MSDHKKESKYKHLRLIKQEQSEASGPEPERAADGCCEDLPNVQLVDETYLARLVQQHIHLRPFSLAFGHQIALVFATALLVGLGAAQAFRCLEGRRPKSVLTQAPKPPPEEARGHRRGPRIVLVSQTRPQTPPNTVSYSIQLHNLPGALTPSASHVAICVTDAVGHRAWVAPAQVAAGAPWSLPAVQTLQMPDGPFLQGRVGSQTRLVALFLRGEVASKDLLAWAAAGADASNADFGTLKDGLLTAQTITF